MAETIVGTIAYDVRLNFDQVKKDAAKADKIASDLAKKISKTQKDTSSGSGTSKSSTSSNTAGDQVAASIESTKAAAQQAFNSLSAYTPKIQGQFLVVERANMRVENATGRASAAITKYGADSTQAISATNSLKAAVLSQSQAQQTLTNSINTSTAKVQKSDSAFSSFANGGLKALTVGVIAAAAEIAVNIGNAVSRFDTLNNAPKVLQNLGNSAKDSKDAVAILDQGIRGLPTSLDSAVTSLTAIAGATDMNAKSSAALALSFNNMALAGGKGAGEAERAFVQFTQSLGRGKIGMQEFNTLSEVMPAQLSQVSKSLLGANANTSTLRDAMTEGKVTMAQFTAEILKLNSQGGPGFASFEQQAKDATAGIATGVANMNTAVTRGIEDVIRSIGGPEIQNGLQSIGKSFETGLKYVGTLIETTRSGFQPIAMAMAPAIAAGQQFLGVISPLAMVLAPLATGLATYAAAFGGIALGVYVANKALSAFSSMLTLVSRHPIIAALSLIVSLITAISTASGIGNLQAGLDDSADSSVDIDQAMKDAMSHIGGAADNSDDLAKKLAKIDDQAQKIRDDFRDQLAELINSKKESIKQLTSQLDDERTEYQKSYTDRLSDFNKSQNEEEQTHLQKTARLTAQIDFLKKYQNASNKQQLSDLQFSLARENALYTQQANDQQAKYDEDAAADKASHDKKTAELQAQLDGETSLLDKHREDVASIQGVILADEIDKLKQGRDEQLKSLDQQRIDAVNGNAQTGAAAGAAFGDAINGSVSDALKKMKDNTVNTLSDNNWLKQMQGSFQKNWENNGGDFWKPMKDSFANTIGLLSGQLEIKNGQIRLKPGNNGGGGGFASGGFTGRGGVNEPAGIVHRGEYVLPQNMVNQTTGLPKIDSSSNNVQSSQPSIKVTVNASANMIRSQSDKREFATMIVDAFNQIQRAKKLPELGKA